MFLSNVKFYVKSLIPISAWPWSTFNISEDFETWQHIETSWDTVSTVLKTSTQIERFTITATWWIATIVQRWLTQWDTKVVDNDLRRQWTDGTVWYITALASDMLDIDKSGWQAVIYSDIDFQWEYEFNWPVEFKNKLKIPTFLSESARNTVYTSPVNWDSCFVVWIWQMIYSWWVWQPLLEGLPTPNASTTVAGKVEEAIDAEITAWTSTGSTWARLFASITQFLKSLSFSPTTTTAEDDKLAFTDVSDSHKNKSVTKANFRNELSASDTLKGTSERATSAEAITGTDNERYMTPLITKDSIKDSISSSQTSLNFWTNYQATTSWYVCGVINWAYNNSTATHKMKWYVWGTNPAGTMIASSQNSWDNTITIWWWVCFPVSKWQWYRVDWSVNNWDDYANKSLYFIANK